MHTILRIPPQKRAITVPVRHRKKTDVCPHASFTFPQVSALFWMLSELTTQTFVLKKKKNYWNGNSQLIFQSVCFFSHLQQFSASVDSEIKRSQRSIHILFAPLFIHQALWKEQLGTATSVIKACVKCCWQPNIKSTILRCGSCSPTPPIAPPRGLISFLATPSPKPG